MTQATTSVDRARTRSGRHASQPPDVDRAQGGLRGHLEHRGRRCRTRAQPCGHRAHRRVHQARGLRGGSERGGGRPDRQPVRKPGRGAVHHHLPAIRARGGLSRHHDPRHPRRDRAGPGLAFRRTAGSGVRCANVAGIRAGIGAFGLSRSGDLHGRAAAGTRSWLWKDQHQPHCRRSRIHRGFGGHRLVGPGRDVDRLRQPGPLDRAPGVAAADVRVARVGATGAAATPDREDPGRLWRLGHGQGVRGVRHASLGQSDGLTLFRLRRGGQLRPGVQPGGSAGDPDRRADSRRAAGVVRARETRATARRPVACSDPDDFDHGTAVGGTGRGRPHRGRDLLPPTGPCWDRC